MRCSALHPDLCPHHCIRMSFRGASLLAPRPRQGKAWRQSLHWSGDMTAHLLQTVALKAGELLLLIKEEDLQSPAGRRLWLLMKENSSLRGHLACWRPGIFYRVFMQSMDGSGPAQAPPPPHVLDTKQLVHRESNRLTDTV